MTGTTLYVVELEMPPAHIAEFTEWFANRHAVDLFKSGFQNCSCYRAVEGGMNLCDIYELTDPEIFWTAAYQNVRKLDPHNAIIQKRTDHTSSIYTQRRIDGAPAGAPMEMLDADWVTMIRFDAPPQAEAELVAWIEGNEWPLLSAVGASRLRFGAHSFDHPLAGPSKRPRCVALAEWSERPGKAAEIAARLNDRFAGEVSRLDAYVGYRIYPWANKPVPAGN